jgi:hypothetical protein
MKRGVLILGLVCVAAVATGAVYFRSAPTAQGGFAVEAVDVPADARAPEGVRIRVEVLNATKTKGLARRATRYLRDLGFDVVSMGNSAKTQDNTVVLDRSNHPDWAGRVAQSLGDVKVETRPDSSRYVDVTVLIGATWRPPPEPFHP